MSRVPNPRRPRGTRAPASSDSPRPSLHGTPSLTKSRTPFVGAASQSAARPGSPARHSEASAASAARRPSSSAAAASASSPSPRRTAGGQLRRRRGHVDIATRCSSTWVRADACRRRSAQWSAPSHVRGMWTSLPKDTWIDGAVPDARHWCGHAPRHVEGVPGPQLDGPLDRVRRRAGQVAAAVAFISARRHGRRPVEPRARATSWPPTPAGRRRRGGRRAAARSARPAA